MWQDPKTNWQSTDYFNFSDYNRIKNNIAYLRELALELFVDFPYEEMGEDKNSYAQYPYADEFTLMEENLEKIRQNTFAFDKSESKEWYENMLTPNYEDFNRLERACFSFKKGFDSIKENKRSLSFRLGDTSPIKI